MDLRIHPEEHLPTRVAAPAGGSGAEEGQAIKRFGRARGLAPFVNLVNGNHIGWAEPPRERNPAMAVPGLFWIELGLGVVLLFLSAKAHGRQIRLERGLEGYMEGDFMKENPPWVEALWRKDRRRFWPTFALAIAVLSAAGLLILSTPLETEPLRDPIL